MGEGEIKFSFGAKDIFSGKTVASEQKTDERPVTTSTEPAESKSTVPTSTFSFTSRPRPQTPPPTTASTPFLFSTPIAQKTTAFATPDHITSRISAFSFGGQSQPVSENAIRRLKRRREKGERFLNVVIGSARKRRGGWVGSEDEDGRSSDEEDFGRAGRDTFRGRSSSRARGMSVGSDMSRGNGRFDEPNPFYDGTSARMAAYKDLPYILTGFFQALFVAFILAVLGYFVYHFVKTVQRDVDSKVEEYSMEIIAEIAACSKSYITNKCDPDSRVPGMEKACRGWESCMNRDPDVVGRAKVSAETFAEIINSFVDPISYKTMFFFLAFVFGSLIVSSPFWSVRGVQRHHQPAPPNVALYPPGYGGPGPDMAISGSRSNAMWVPANSNRFIMG